MSARRLLKAGEAIREVVAMAILTEIRDPRVKNITVIGVEVAPDMREAKVLISIMGSESQQATSLRGLQNSAGFLQAKKHDTFTELLAEPQLWVDWLRRQPLAIDIETQDGSFLLTHAGVWPAWSAAGRPS